MKTVKGTTCSDNATNHAAIFLSLVSLYNTHLSIMDMAYVKSLIILIPVAFFFRFAYIYGC